MWNRRHTKIVNPIEIYDITVHTNRYLEARRETAEGNSASHITDLATDFSLCSAVESQFFNTIMK